MRLYQIQAAIEARVDSILATGEAWPCREGCDDCCRSLAAEPRVSGEEWSRIRDAIHALPPPVAAAALERIRDTASQPRPIICPLLDRATGACLIYQARPLVCRAYGFYAERGAVLGCHRIEAVSLASPHVIWGNHAALEDQIHDLGPLAELSSWLARQIEEPPTHGTVDW